MAVEGLVVCVVIIFLIIGFIIIALGTTKVGDGEFGYVIMFNKFTKKLKPGWHFVLGVPIIANVAKIPIWAENKMSVVKCNTLDNFPLSIKYTYTISALEPEKIINDFGKVYEEKYAPHYRFGSWRYGSPYTLGWCLATHPHFEKLIDEQITMRKIMVGQYIDSYITAKIGTFTAEYLRNNMSMITYQLRDEIMKSPTTLHFADKYGIYVQDIRINEITYEHTYNGTSSRM